MIGRPLHRRVIAGLNCIKKEKKKKKEKRKKKKGGGGGGGGGGGVFLDIKRSY